MVAEIDELRLFSGNWTRPEIAGDRHLNAVSSDVLGGARENIFVGGPSPHVQKLFAGSDFLHLFHSESSGATPTNGRLGTDKCWIWSCLGRGKIKVIGNTAIKEFASNHRNHILSRRIATVSPDWPKCITYNIALQIVGRGVPISHEIFAENECGVSYDKRILRNIGRPSGVNNPLAHGAQLPPEHYQLTDKNDQRKKPNSYCPPIDHRVLVAFCFT
jgi:hypothetical protein